MSTIKNTPLVTVVVPVYNAENTIHPCVESILSQDYKNYDIIMVDNDSRDGTLRILRQYSRSNDNLTVLNHAIRKKGSVRNFAIKQAKGDLIAMTDADCIVPVGWISSLVRAMEPKDADAVLGSEKPTIKNYWSNMIQSTSNEFLMSRIKNGYVKHIDTKNFIIKSEIIQRIAFNESVHQLEDFDLYLRSKGGLRIAYDSSIIVMHHHPTTVMGTLNQYFRRGVGIQELRKIHGDRHLQEAMFESTKLVNNLKFPAWMIKQVISTPPKRSFFTLVSELSWRSGIIWAKLRQMFP